MNQITTLLVLAVLSSQTHSAPQFISFKDGKLGVNFGGYHAGVGIGGLLGGGSGAGGLYAEAGTPTGQAARAGLGGVVSENGGTSGGLYAGATAGGNVKAHAGLGGGVTAEKSAGGGFASAQAGPHYAASGLGGETSVEGVSEFTFSKSKDVIKPVHKTFYTEYNVDATNEVKPLPKVDILKEVHIQESPQPEIVKEVSNLWRAGTEFNKNVNLLHDFHNLLSSLLSVTITADNTERFRRKPQHMFDYAISQVYVPPKTKVVEKEIIHTHYKPRRHHLRKTAFLGGYIGGQGNIVGPPASSPPLVYKTVEPTIQKRIDVGAEATAHVDTGAGIQGHGGIGGGQYYKKEVSIQRSPTFFSDIFNIPISALKAVGDFLGNTAANTNISVQKTASVQAESDEKSLKHDPLSPLSSVSSASHVSVETPSASKIIDDIFAIPINTLAAVNKFLENTVAARKNVQVSEDGTVAKRTRIGPHVRRRVNKHVIVVQEPSPTNIE